MPAVDVQAARLPGLRCGLRDGRSIECRNSYCRGRGDEDPSSPPAALWAFLDLAADIPRYVKAIRSQESSGRTWDLVLVNTHHRFDQCRHLFAQGHRRLTPVFLSCSCCNSSPGSCRHHIQGGQPDGNELLLSSGEVCGIPMSKRHLIFTENTVCFVQCPKDTSQCRALQ